MPLIRKPASEPAPERAPADLASTSADARWAAARSLGAPGDVPTLAAALESETEPRVREAIFTSLARIGGPDSARALARQIRSDDASLRTGALDALRGMASELGLVLPDLLGDADPDLRLLACELVRAAPTTDATARLCELLKEEREVNVAGAAVEVLCEVGDRTALPALDRCAERFRAEPFLVFAIGIARERIGAQ